MLPDRVSNPGPLTYKSGVLPIALRGPGKQKGNGRVALHERVPVHHNIITVAMCIFLQDHRTDLEAS